MHAPASNLDGGFHEPVFMAQAVFRQVMTAMSRPGTEVSVPDSVSPPALLDKTVAAIACTLADIDTPIWLDPALASSEGVKGWLAFHTGARFTDDAGEAGFALITDIAAMPSLEAFAQGSQEYPDRSTSLILRLPGLEGGSPLSFEGPGIRERVTISPLGLPADFTRQWNANRERFPRGVDLILVSDGSLICLPRSARLVSAEG